MVSNYSTDLNGIPKLARHIAHQLQGGEVFALLGDLGAGKTTFSKALAKELEVSDTVTSPTFVLMNRYKGKLPKAKREVFLYHLDLYRTHDFDEVKALGLEEIWQQPETITLIEWADKIAGHMPKDTVTIYFTGRSNK